MKPFNGRAALLIPSLLMLLTQAAATEAPVAQGAETSPAPNKIPAETASDGKTEASPPASLVPSSLMLSLNSLGVESWADVVQPGYWSGSLDLGYDVQQQSINVPTAPNQTFTGRLMRESIRIRNENFAVIHPMLLSGNLGLGFSLTQSRQDAADNQSKQTGVLTDYNVDATILGEKAYPTHLYANHSQNLTTRPFGTTEGISDNRGAIVRLRENSILRENEILPYFTANARVQQEHTQSVTTVAGQRFRRDDRRSMFNLDFHNGFETADLDFHYETTDFTNVFYTLGNYQSQSASLRYSQDFGKNLNRRWDSNLSYTSRDGATELSTLNMEQSLIVEHYKHFASSYNYGFTQQTTPGGQVTAQNIGARLQHKLYANLTTSAGVTGSLQTMPGGRIEAQGAQLGFGYSHSFPLQGQFNASLGGSYAYNSNKLDKAILSVFDMPFETPQQFGAGAGFFLRDKFIVPESVEVIHVKDGARTLATLGIDYMVAVEGDRTRILPQPTSALIMPGDVLAVSYSFRIDPSVTFQTISRSSSVGAEWHWIGISLSRDQSDQRPLLGGDASYLTSDRRDTARVGVHNDFSYLRARADATLVRVDGTARVYNEKRASQHISFYYSEAVTMNLSADQYSIEYLTPQRRTSGISTRVGVDWITAGGWLNTGYLSRRYYRDSDMPSEIMTEAGMKMQRKWTKLFVAMVAGLSERRRGAGQTLGASLHFSASRKF